jgi:hypothetical protein
LVLGIIGFALASITHKFTLQVIVFTAPLLSILVGSVWIAAALVYGLLAAILITRGRALKVWRSHIGYSRLYRSHIAPRFPIVRDTVWVILRNMFRALRSGDNWRREAIRLVFNNEIDWIVQLSWIGPVGVLAALRPVNAPPEFFYLATWVLGTVIVGLMTTLRPLRFLGQPTRYLEYAVLPASVVLGCAAVGIPEFPAVMPVVLGILAFSVVIVTLYYAVAFIIHRRIRLDEFSDVVAWLAEQPSQVILCAPVHGFSSAVWKETNHTIVGWLGQMNDQTSEDWLEDYLLLCPEQHFVLPHDLSRVIDRYAVNMVLRGPGTEHDLSDMTQAYSSGAYAVYRVG